jgi:ABC-type sugar transport system ATPase subunit
LARHGEHPTLEVTDDPPVAAPGSLVARNVTHRFSEGLALSGVSFDLHCREIHALVGENGAGKTTLIKLLTGVLGLQEGAIEIDGRPVRMRSPHDAQRYGIAVVHQNYHLFPALTVAENIIGIGSRVPRASLFLSRRRMRQRAREVLSRCGADIDPDCLAADLNAAERKFVEIARALTSEVRFLFLDEPTAALDRPQTDLLISLMRRLRDEGAGLVFVTHHLDEVLQAADRCTVLRNGEQVGVLARGQDLKADEVVIRMLGRKHSPGEFARSVQGPNLVRVRDLRLRAGARPISLDIRSGQVIGVLGLVGSGAATILRRISGVVARPSARITVDGTELRIRSVRDGLAAGIAYIPEDRRTSGVFAEMSVASNLAIAALDRVSQLGLVRPRRQNALAEQYRRALDVRCRALDQLVGTLSGGNQQKVMIGRGLASGARIMVIEEPTQGVDIGARREIHGLLRNHAQSGGAVIFLSSDLDELVDLADEIAVIRHGELVNLVNNGTGDSVSHDYLMAQAAGLGMAPSGEVA